MIVGGAVQPKRWLPVLVVALVLSCLSPVLGSEEDYALALPEDVVACARALAWSSGYRHISHSDERWSARENSPREMCEECGAPMCVVCMEYDLGTYDTRPGTSASLRGCHSKVESYLRRATLAETEILAAVYWTAYWDGRHNRVGDIEPEIVVVGQPGPNGGIEFETPFILGVDSLVVPEMGDCSSDAGLDAAAVTAEFVFAERAKPFYEPGDLSMVILTADSYASEVVTEFDQARLDDSQPSSVSLVPLQTMLCLTPLADGACVTCTVKLEILSDNGTSVKARLVHCNDDHKWEQWFKGDLPRHKEAPPEKCKTCNYWLKYEQVKTVDQKGNPMVYGMYTLYHCKPDNVWQQVFVHTVSKVTELPKGKCQPGHEVIVVSEFTRDGKTYVRHTLYRCSSAGQWISIGSWTEPKG